MFELELLFDKTLYVKYTYKKRVAYGYFLYICINKQNDEKMALSTGLTGKARFDARLSAEEKALFEKAAELGGFRSLTEFVLRSAHKRAKEIIDEYELIIASKRDSDIFFNAILNPEPPNAKLKAAAAKFKKQ